VILFTLTIVGAGEPVFGQYKSEKDATIPLEHFYIQRKKVNPIRLLLSKFTVGLSTGYGSTSFKHKLDGFGILERKSGSQEIFDAKNISSSYSSWVSAVNPSHDTTGIANAVNSDSTKLGFKSHTISIPLKATIHLEFDRYRIGGGYSFDYTHVGMFRPTGYSTNIQSFKLDKQGFFMKHYFGMIGASVYRYYEYLLVVDANIGGFKLGRQFNMAQIQKGMYVNIGATVEREMSEYFKVFVRPSYEIRKYSIAIPETGKTLTQHLNTFYVNFGVSYRLPELPKCFLRECHAQINHAHGNREYRSRVHPIYKKQNPHYGENYPTLIKYKGKNKRKLNPY
jgi:hypothetical protein